MQNAKVFDEISLAFEFGAVQKCVIFVDIVKSFQTSTIKYVLAKFGFDTAENGPLKVCQKKCQKLEKT